MNLAEQIKREQQVTAAVVAMVEALGALPDDEARLEAIRRLGAGIRTSGAPVKAKEVAEPSAYGEGTSRILGIVRASPGILTADIATAAGLNRETTRVILHRLKERGDVSVHHVGNKAHWSPTRQAEAAE